MREPRLLLPPAALSGLLLLLLGAACQRPTAADPVEEAEPAPEAPVFDTVSDTESDSEVVVSATEPSPPAEHPEVVAVRQRIEVLRIGVETLDDAGLADGAERLEEAIVAREMRIERRRDQEAREAYQRAPDRSQLAEWLQVAAQVAADQGEVADAAALAELSRTYQEQGRRRPAPDPEPVALELDSLATRIEILRYARDAFAEVGDRHVVDVLEGAVHWGELALEGADPAALGEAAAAVPSKPILIECLAWSSQQYAEWNRSERAEACRQLADYYAAQLGGDEGAEAQDEEREPEAGIEELDRRIEILGYALDAFRRSGDGEAAAAIGRFHHLAELQRAGRPDPTVAEGLTMGMVIELLQAAGGLYADWGWEGRAGACHELAEYYAARERERAHERDGGEVRGADHEARPLDLRERVDRLEVLRLVRAAYAEAGADRARDLAERALHLGELEQVGAPAEDRAAAAEGLNTQRLIRLSRGAAGLYQEWGIADRARACAALGDYYAQRAAPAAAPEAGPSKRVQELREQLRRVRALQEAAARTEARILELLEQTQVRRR